MHSCNYDCEYCPFAKAKDSHASLERDASDLTRFVDWASRYSARPLRILFTPWGEALIRRHYREALITLSHLEQVARVAAQTNLSCDLSWLQRAERARVALWCTYHPSQVSRARFLAACARLDGLGIRYSVGIVGLREHFDEIGAMRRALPGRVYLWVNAYKRDGYYHPDDIGYLQSVDPLFRVNLQDHESLGRRCYAGEDAIAVDGDGTVRRCHFIGAPIGRLYDSRFDDCLKPRPCSRASCRCHIGYVHMPALGLRDTFGEGVLERIPARLSVLR